ncbi:hypothetical protein [Paenibacillus sp. LjRoot56]|uniref:hypothetical protein n=1 Tax=Paenibacillus sp. LjRoot56 TaxID=3342333 RepID=UPI003ECCE9FA
MKSLQAFLKNKNMLIRIILSYLLVGLLVIAVLTFVIASKVSRNLTEQINRSTDTAIEQSFNTANILLTSTFTNFAADGHRRWHPIARGACRRWTSPSCAWLRHYGPCFA